MSNPKRNEKWCVNICTDTLRGPNPLHYEHPRDQKELAERIRQGGVSPESGHYIGQLARYPGDPEAVVSSKSEIRDLLQRRNIRSTGFVKNEFRRD